jgi:hypothetical protein
MVGIEYTQGLITPHPMQNKGEEAQLLDDVIDITQIADQIDQLPDTDHEDVRIAAADFVAYQVRKALWHPQITSERDDFKAMGVTQPPRLEDLKRKQAADCLGFTLVTSTYLDLGNVDHMIGFANGHATIVVDSDKEEELFLLDPLSPELDQNLHPALIKSEVAELRSLLDQHGRAAMKLNSTKMIESTRVTSPNPFALHPWLSTRDRRIEGYDSLRSSDDHAPETIVMSLFQPRIGQEMVVHYSQLRHAALMGHPNRAVNALYRLGENYPDMDARKRHKELQWVAGHLAIHGHTKGAVKVIDNYFKTFDFIGDSRFAEAKGDNLARVARISRSPAIARLAIIAYEQALEHPRAYKQAVTGKRHKLAQRLSSLVEA